MSAGAADQERPGRDRLPAAESLVCPPHHVHPSRAVLCTYKGVSGTLADTLSVLDTLADTLADRMQVLLIESDHITSTRRRSVVCI